MLRRILSRIFAALLIFVALPALAQNVGDCVRLKATHPDGVPRHVESRNSFSGERFPDQSVVRVEEKSPDAKWLRVSLTGDISWVSAAYVGAIVPCGGATPTPPAAEIVVGTWNIEYLKDGYKRGFPEYQAAAEKFPPRTDADYQLLAGVIRGLDAKVLALQEINGVNTTGDDGDTVASSVEMDRLVPLIGPTYRYVISASGDAQRIAILYDQSVVHLRCWLQAALPDEIVDGKRLFDRQPLLAFFTVFRDGQEMNDFAVIGVHLASEQDKVLNHDMAMTRIDSWVKSARAAGTCIPASERDLLIMGDFNASRFDSAVEALWTTMEADMWDVLADDIAQYPATRLSGRPPAQHNSRIDYIIASKGPGALQGDELSQSHATIHDNLVAAHGGGLAFRASLSDHLPVTVRLKVRADDD